jgi:hypothetical protein
MGDKKSFEEIIVGPTRDYRIDLINKERKRVEDRMANLIGELNNNYSRKGDYLQTNSNQNNYH